MTREEFARFLEKLRKADEKGEDTDAIVKTHEKHNVYFYNDACIKKILASEKNIALTADLINAALNLVGAEQILLCLPRFSRGSPYTEPIADKSLFTFVVILRRINMFFCGVKYEL